MHYEYSNFAFKQSKPIKHHLFSDTQLEKNGNLQISTIVRFMPADKYETKFINPSFDIWDFRYSVRSEMLDFNEDNFLDEHEIKLLKYFLIYYMQINNPAFLSSCFKQTKPVFRNQNTVTLLEIANQAKMRTNIELDDLLAPYLIPDFKAKTILKIL